MGLDGRRLPLLTGRKAGLWVPRQTFTPASITGLVGWYDADRITGLAHGAAVTTWPDLSGTGAHITQGTSGARPTYRVGVANGLPVVRFDGADDRLETSGSHQIVNASTGHWTVFAVMAKTAYSGVRGVVSGDNVGGSSNRVAQFLRWNGATSESIGFAGPVLDAGPTGSGSAFHIDEAVRNSSDLERLVDGVSNGATAGGALSTAVCGVSVGHATNQGGAAGFHNGDVGEVLLYNVAVSSTDRTAIREYLAEKWGVT